MLPLYIYFLQYYCALKGPIAFDNKLAYQTALEGSNFVVKCSAQGQSGVPKMYWKVDQKSPQGNSIFNVIHIILVSTIQFNRVSKRWFKYGIHDVSGPKFKVIKDGLMIYNVTKEDSKRNFACFAMDIDSPMPDAKSLNIALHVTSKFLL